MPTEITMPKLSDTMTEGRLISWKKGVGERVERGDIIAEVETDKANMELEAFVSGVLLETRVKPGEMAPVGTVIAVVGEAGEAAPPVEEKAAPPPSEPERQRPAAEPVRGTAAVAEVPARVIEKPEAAEVTAHPSVGEAGEAEKASPLVRRLAREQRVDLKLVSGSGPDGRILREDLERFLSDQKVTGDRAPGTGTGGTPLTGEKGMTAMDGTSKPLSRMRAAIARTVSQAWQNIPHFAVTVAIDMGEAEEVRRELKEAGAILSLNDLIVKAAAVALEKFPQVNNSFAGDRISVNGEINIGIAVALEEGLVVPVIRGCRQLSVKEIAVKSRGLIDRVKSGKIIDGDISGGTFTISNLGMYGMEEFMAVIFPPQGAILAVGAIMDKPVIRGGHIAAARVMHATLSADHRLIDGAYAAQFLQELRKVLENPVAMLV
jgi:pyruvate dehydrogenase E2 component (dihydrolipoamide acetyltransferase)